MDIWVVSTLGLLWIMLLWTYLYTVWCIPMFSFRNIHMSGIAGSYSNSMFNNFLRNCQTVFQSSCVILHSRQQCTRLPVSLHTDQHLLLSVILIIASQWVWRGVSSWFRFAFPWWLMMLSISSCAYWPFVHLLWRNVCSPLLPIFSWLICLFIIESPLLPIFSWLICLFIIESYEFFVYSRCRSFIRYIRCQNVLHFCGLPSLSYNDLWRAKVFNFDDV